MTKPSAPEFWNRSGLMAHLLEPAAWTHARIGAARWALTRPWRASVPIVCVGNIVAGGAGKTPVVLTIAARLRRAGLTVHLLSRGYGGRAAGPLAVDPALHGAVEVGDEPLLLARAAPTWVARDRAAGALAALNAGAGLIVMDDGFQNPSLSKDLSLLVIDAAYGFGNGRVIPAGPLREPIAGALKRADAVVLLGPEEVPVRALLGRRPLIEARLVPQKLPRLDRPVVAFAGIGRPKKFFRMLAAAGAEIAACHAFPDHHPYRADELARIERPGATLVTTAKDWVRLPLAWRARVEVLEIAVDWQDEAALDALLLPMVERARG
ncbi:MAG: tetraacyldisaccharide 4'-kinase [Stellaceae bacterium]